MSLNKKKKYIDIAAVGITEAAQEGAEGDAAPKDHRVANDLGVLVLRDPFGGPREHCLLVDRPWA